MVLDGTDDISGTGNGSDNVLTGNTGNNALWGLDGNDTLLGPLGAFEDGVNPSSKHTTQYGAGLGIAAEPVFRSGR